MAKRKFEICFLTVFLIELKWTTAALCGGKQNITLVEIPDERTLMSIGDFGKFIVDKSMGEVHFALPQPPAFLPDINYFSTIVKDVTSSGYLQNTIGESLGSNPTCARGSTPLKPLPFSDRAVFYRSTTTTAQFHWSSCPSKYMWSMRCARYTPGQKLCNLNDVMLGVYIHDSLDDLPMLDIVEDLCHATDVKFGAAEFKWFFSYGRNTLC